MRFLSTRIIVGIGLGVLAALLGSASGLQAQEGSSWPMYRGANQDGISNETGWTTKWPEGGPKTLWKTNVGAGFTTVAVANGRLYTMGNPGNKDTVFCLDAATGRELWKFTYDCKDEANPGPRATPTIDGNRVYTVSRRAQLYCFDAESGKVLWEQDLRKSVGAAVPYWGYACSPLIFENLLILQAGAKDGAVVALDKSDGKLVWKSGAGEGSYSTPVLYRKDGKACLAVFLGDGLIALDAKAGTPLWKFPYKAQWNITITHPIVVGDKAYISDGYGGGAVLLDISGDEPKVVWKTIEFSNQRATSVLWKGYLYGIDGDNERKPFLKCYEFASGKEMWTHEGLGNGSLMLAGPSDKASGSQGGGKLIIQGEKGDLVVAEASPEGYQELARAKPLGGKCWTMPVLCGGRIYCRSHEGELVCVDVSGE